MPPTPSTTLVRSPVRSRAIPYALFLFAVLLLLPVGTQVLLAEHTPSIHSQKAAHPHRKTARPPSAPAPHVTYADGKLTVQSSGASLASVLDAIHQATGIEISGAAAAGADNQKLVGSFGPGRPANVLADVLENTRINYILLKSVKDPGLVRSVLLSAQSPAPAQTAPAAPAAPPPAATPPEPRPSRSPQQNPPVSQPRSPQDQTPQSQEEPGSAPERAPAPDTSSEQPPPH